MQPLLVEPTLGSDHDELVYVWRSKSARVGAERPLALVHFMRRTAELAKAANSTCELLRHARNGGLNGDWRLDEKTGNHYLPAGIATGQGAGLSSV